MQMGLKTSLLKAYFAAEGAYYSAMDFLERRLGLPVYEYYVTPIESRGVPSFPVTTAIAVAVIALLALLLLPAPAAPTEFCLRTASGSTVYVKGPGIAKTAVAVKGRACFEGLPEDVNLSFSIERGGKIVFEGAGAIKDLPKPWTPSVVAPEEEKKLLLVGPEELKEPPEEEVWKNVDDEDVLDAANEVIAPTLAVVKVSVVDGKGNAVNVDTRIALFNADTDTVIENTTARGSPAIFAQVPIGKFRVRAHASARGFVENSSEPVNVESEEVEITVVLEKLPEGSPNVTIRVSEAVAGTPVENAEVSVWKLTSSGLGDVAAFEGLKTNKEGKISFGPLLASGEYLAKVKKRFFFEAWKKFKPGEVVEANGTRTLDVILEMVTGENTAVLRVKAVNYTNNLPVKAANVSVYATVEGIRMKTHFASTNATGDAVIPSAGGVPFRRGIKVDVAAEHYGLEYIAGRIDNVSLDAASVYRNITLYPPKGVLRLKAFDFFKQELANASFNVVQKRTEYSCRGSGCAVEVYAGSASALWARVYASVPGYACFEKSAWATANAEKQVNLTCIAAGCFTCRATAACTQAPFEDCGIDSTGETVDELPFVGARIFDVGITDALGRPLSLPSLQIGRAYRVEAMIASDNASTIGVYLRAGGVGDALNSSAVVFGVEGTSLSGIKPKLHAARASRNYSMPYSTCFYKVVNVERLEAPDELFKWVELEVNASRTLSAVSVTFYLFVNPFYCGRKGVSCTTTTLYFRGFAYDAALGKYKRVPFDPVLKYEANVTPPS